MKLQINESQDGKYFFVIKAKNHQVLATSETYNTLQAVVKGINSLIEGIASEDLRVTDTTGKMTVKLLAKINGAQ
jgi:uncharacterized protein YegP (UPF0339 family)